MPNIYRNIFKVLPEIVPFEKLISKVNNLIIPLYHCISDENDINHIKYLYRVKNVAAFLKDLEFLLKYYEPINVLDVKDIIYNDKKLKRPAILFSFDDGFRECYDVIAPILMAKGIPAIFFLNSGFIDNKDLFYRCKISLLINEVVNDERKLKIIGESKSLDTSIKFLKTLNYNDIALIEELAKKIDFSFEDYLITKRPYMDNDEVKFLIKSGFHIGSHSINHPNYNHISFDMQLHQTVTSTKSICDLFNLDYRFFAFPFTDNKITIDFYDKILNDECDLTFGTSGSRADKFIGSLQRISFEVYGINAKEILSKYMLSMILRKINKSYYINRKRIVQ